MSSSAVTFPSYLDPTKAADGSAASPSFAFANSTSTGIYRVSANTLGISTAGVQRVVVDANGNVGIGGAPDGYKLDIASGYARIARGIAYNASASVGIDLGAVNADSVNNSATYAWGQEVTGNAMGQALSFKRYRKADSTVEAMRLDASGNLLVAGTNNNGRITITQNTQFAYERGLSFYFSPTSYWNIVNGFSSRLYFGFANGVGGYTDKAYVEPSTGAWVPVSDLRAKKNIESISYGLDAVLNLNPVKYHMKEEEETSAKHLGFIAQEVKQIISEAVSEQEDEDRLLGLDKSALVPVLVKAIQELSAKVEEQSSRIDAQAEEIKALKAQP